ncbi:hypothetical protein RPW65_00350 [Pseudomonas sp. NyZ704]|nr:hypothetical protein RPW65_00350 [Pseudomonas sp. NyZ704]
MENNQKNKRKSKEQIGSQSASKTKKNIVNSNSSTGRFVSSNGDNNARVLAATVGGAVIGNMIIPGIGGAIFGGLAGAILGKNSNKETDDE